MSVTSGMREAFRWAYPEEEEFVSCCPEAEEVERYGVLRMDPCACDRQSPERMDPVERIGQIKFVAYKGRVFISRT